MAKIVVPSTNTVITSAWGKSVADSLNAGYWETFVNAELAATVVGTPNTTVYASVAITLPFAGELFVNGSATVELNAGSGAQETYVALTTDPAGPTVTLGPDGHVSVNPFNAHSIPVMARYAAAPAGAGNLRFRMYVGTGTPSLKLFRVTALLRLLATASPSRP